MTSTILGQESLKPSNQNDNQPELPLESGDKFRGVRSRTQQDRLRDVVLMSLVPGSAQELGDVEGFLNLSLEGFLAEDQMAVYLGRISLHQQKAGADPKNAQKATILRISKYLTGARGDLGALKAIDDIVRRSDYCDQLSKDNFIDTSPILGRGVRVLAMMGYILNHAYGNDTDKTLEFSPNKEMTDLLTENMLELLKNKDDNTHQLVLEDLGLYMSYLNEKIDFWSVRLPQESTPTGNI